MSGSNLTRNFYLWSFIKWQQIPVVGQEDSLHAKKNYEKYLSALKNSGLVSVEEKNQGATADAAAGAEGGAGAMSLLGESNLLSSKY